ncbi:hypothetical protein ACFONJ_13375 [Chryseobacterium tructae]|uniref:Lipoprotein n=1 Tax=Chryseobacterium tructae TaxID=1037380 RepID=A0ABV7XVV7_9FLAO
MKNILLILLVSLISPISCNKKNNENENRLKRFVFDSGNLKFISNSLNPKKETMAALYGNEKALASLSREDSKPEVGALMKLVTWRYHDNPQYIGGKITGELVSIETVQTDINGNTSYVIQNTSAENPPHNKEERIQYFMSYHPVNRP